LTITAAHAADLGFVPEKLAQIAEYIQAKYLDTGLLPFAALRIARRENIALDWQSGVAANALFRIASMTKPVTSIAAMQLVAAGRLSLSDPVTHYIPEFSQLGVYVSGGNISGTGDAPFVTRPPIRPMSILDLMRHTSGLTYSFQDRSPVDAAYKTVDVESWTTHDSQGFIDKLAAIPLEFDPGSQWNYSVSTDVLGVIVERISRQKLGDYFRDHIFAPLGMQDTFFTVPTDKAARLPNCYMFDPKVTMKAFDRAGADSLWAKGWAFESGGGGLASTVEDYQRFCRMLLNGGTLDGVKIINPDTLAQMTANHLPGGGDLTQHSLSMFSEADNAGIGFGLGFATTIDPAAVNPLYSAGDFYWGGMYSTAFFVDPVKDIIMIFMTQLMPSSLYPVRKEIKSMLYAALQP
jgi:CubicO group peptidase (beta-lactamase class C family)